MKGESSTLEGELNAMILYGRSILGGNKSNPSSVLSFSPNSVLVFLKNKFIYLFIYGCVGSLLLHVGFL